MDANGENEKVKKKAEEEFLHIIDVDKILCETGLDLDGLCKLVKLDSQTINRWGCKKSKNGNRPKYNAAVRLLRAGATVETLFGVEYKPNAVQNSSVTPPAELANDPAFQKGLQQSIDAKVSAAVKAEIAALKSKGML